MTTAVPDATSAYYDPAVETMARDRIEQQQLAALLDLLPHAYEHAPLVRMVWEEAGVHPRDIRTLDDFRHLAPFVDKDAVRRYRDAHDDPFGGICAVPIDELTAVMSTSGTTGDPTLVPEQWGGARRGPPALARDFWGMGVRPGDDFMLCLFTFRGPTYAFVQSLGARPIVCDFHGHEMPRLCDLSLRYRPTGLYNFGSVLIDAVAEHCDATGLDPAEVFDSYRGVVFAGEPLGRRDRDRAESWGVELYEHTSVADVGYAFECGEHDGLHTWEDMAFVEALDAETGTPLAPGSFGPQRRVELVGTTLVNRVGPLLRHRSDDLVRMSFEACACGRTHARVWPIGRKGDEVLVGGRAVLPVDVWDAVQSVDACARGLFQVVRPRREVDRLQLRVGYSSRWRDRLAAVEDGVRAAVAAAVGVEPDVELVPDEVLLRLGPPHKIPRVARR